MVSTKDLRDILDEATKRAGDAIGDAKVPSIVRRQEPPVLLYLAIGFAVGALVGVLLGSLATPLSGREARQRIGDRVERMRRGEGILTNGETVPPAAGEFASPATGSYERTT